MTEPLTPIGLNTPLSDKIQADFITLSPGQTIEQALDSVRSQPHKQRIIYFYVVDGENRLVGVVPTRRLLMSPLATLIREIMIDKVISIPDTMTVGDACEFFVMHQLLAFPVVDAENRLKGVVDVNLFTDNMFDTEKFTGHQDVFQVIGMHLTPGGAATPLAAFKDRFPWLLCNIGGGILCAILSSFYENLLNQVIVLALFIPVVLALAESVSMQAMTLTLQALRQNRKIAPMLPREFFTAGLLGFGCGGLVGLISLVWKHEPGVSFAIGASITLSVVTACLLGVLLPVMVKKLRGDPRVAAGPVVLATADLATLLFYFNLAGLLAR